VNGPSQRCHICPALMELHWPSVHYRIKYEVVLVTYMVHTGQRPAYISSSGKSVSTDPCCHQ